MTLPERLARPELDVVWRRVRRAMAAAGDGWATVKVTVPVATDDERRALAGLLGRAVRPGTAGVGVVLGDLDTLVRRPGDGWNLRAVVEAVGGPLRDRRASAALRAGDVEAAVDGARLAGPPAPWFDAWLDGIAADGTVARLVGRRRGELVAIAAAVLGALPLDGEPLPAAAARLTGDTKALSTGPLAGLVLRGIAAMLGEARPAGAAARRAVWEAVGIVPDDLASQVLVLNLPVRAAVGVPGLPGWLSDAAAHGEPVRVTLHQLVRWPVAVAGPRPVFVCENPAVLRTAAEQLGASSAPLVCTEGRPSVAALRLLDQLTDSGASLRVRADFDWPGLRIAGALLERPGAEPWRFSAHDYTRGRHARGARRGPALRGPTAPSPWDQRLAVAMSAAGEALHEEELLDDLVADLR